MRGYKTISRGSPDVERTSVERKTQQQLLQFTAWTWFASHENQFVVYLYRYDSYVNGDERTSCVEN